MELISEDQRLNDDWLLFSCFANVEKPLVHIVTLHLALRMGSGDLLRLVFTSACA